MLTFASMMNDELNHRALRDAIADYEASRARAERELVREKEEVRAQLAADLLPVLDNLDRAIAVGGPVEKEGMRLVRAQLDGVLRGYGVERFDAIGETFDPRRHEAFDVATVAERDHHGLVVEQWQAGYKIGDKVLRPARVKVGRLAA
jgi:molecular chaperone GrpE